MYQSKSEQEPTGHDGVENEAGSDATRSGCGCGPSAMPEMGKMGEKMKGCPCAGMLKKRHMVAGIAVFSIIVLAFLATVTGSVLGTIAFVQSI